MFCAGKVIDTWKTSRGVVWPGERVLIHAFRFNDPADFLRLFEQHRKDLAGVMLEPSGPWAGMEAGHAPDPEPGFLQLLRDKTREAGALLVFDEIMTGYRNPQGSVQKAQGVTPDLTCLGKALVLAEPDPQHRLLMRTLLQQELLRRGVAVFTQGVMLPCYAHDDATLARTLGAFDEAFAIVAQAKQRGTLERQIVIPPLVDT